MATHKSSNPDTTSEHTKGQLFAFCETVRSQIDLRGYDGEDLFDHFDTNMEAWFKARIPPSVVAPVLMRRDLGIPIPEGDEPVWKVEKRLQDSHELGESFVWILPLAQSECPEVVDGIDELLGKDGIDHLEVHRKDGTYYDFELLAPRVGMPLEDRPESIIDINATAYSI